MHCVILYDIVLRNKSIIQNKQTEVSTKIQKKHEKKEIPANTLGIHHILLTCYRGLNIPSAIWHPSGGETVAPHGRPGLL
jgi:hypothetical protein